MALNIACCPYFVASFLFLLVLSDPLDCGPVCWTAWAQDHLILRYFPVFMFGVGVVVWAMHACQPRYLMATYPLSPRPYSRLIKARGVVNSFFKMQGAWVVVYLFLVSTMAWLLRTTSTGLIFQDFELNDTTKCGRMSCRLQYRASAELLLEMVLLQLTASLVYSVLDLVYWLIIITPRCRQDLYSYLCNLAITVAPASIPEIDSTLGVDGGFIIRWFTQNGKSDEAINILKDALRTVEGGAPLDV